MRELGFAALGVLLLGGCAGEDVFEIPEAPLTGLQLQMKPVIVEPGEDIEFCTYFNLDTEAALAAEGKPFLLQELIANGVDPASDELAIGKIEVRGAPGLHHMQILALANDLDDVEDKHIFECAVDLFGGPLTGDVDPLFFTSRAEYSVEYPEGVARVLSRIPDQDDETKTRGTQLLYNFHYLNVTTEPIVAEIVVNLHVVPRETVVHPIQSAWWNYVYFDAKPDVTSTATASGSFLVDVNLVGMTSHQHELGSVFTYELGGEEVYRAENWAEPEYLSFPAETVLAKGDPLNFACEWYNPTGASRYFGLQADDEMCTAIVEYYPSDQAEAAAALAMQAEQNMGNGGPSPFGDGSPSLESFFGMPDEVIAAVATDPDNAFDYIDKDIICGIATNMKQMERQYGRSPETLASLQAMIDILSPICRL